MNRCSRGPTHERTNSVHGPLGWSILNVMTLIPRSIKRWLGARSVFRMFMLLGGLAACLFVVTAWLVSLYWRIGYASLEIEFQLHAGVVCFLYLPGGDILHEGGWSMVHSKSNLAEHWWMKTWDYNPSTMWMIPLWLFMTPCLVSTVVAWRSRPLLRHHCNQCDYDLTGNESGVCPECGREI